MANFLSTKDLVDGALDRVGELTDGTSDFDSSALKYVNSVYQSVIAGGSEFGIEIGEDFYWARANRPIVITLEPKHTTGTISLTNGSTSGTFSSAPTDSLADWHIKADGRSEVFKIAAHTASNTSFTLDAAYTGDTGAALSYKAFKLDYEIFSDLINIDTSNNKIDFRLRKIQTLTFDADIVTDNDIDLSINGTAMTTVEFITDHSTSMTALASQIQTDFAEVGSATVTGAREITINGADPGEVVAVTGVVITNGASQAAGTIANVQAETERTATITVGNYDAASLATELDTQLDAGSEATTGSFSCSYDTVLRKMVVANGTAAETFNLTFSSGTNSLKSAAKVMGFQQYDYEDTYTYTAELSVNPILRLIDPFVLHKGQTLDDDSDRQIFYLETRSFAHGYPLSEISESNPTRFTILDEEPLTGRLKARFNTYPDKQTRVEIDYIQMPVPLVDSDNDIPVLPREHRKILEYGATYYLMLDKSDARAPQYLQLAQSSLQALLSADRKEKVQTAKYMGRVIPRRDMVRSITTRGLVRTTSGLVVND